MMMSTRSTSIIGVILISARGPRPVPKDISIGITSPALTLRGREKFRCTERPHPASGGEFDAEARGRREERRRQEPHSRESDSISALPSPKTTTAFLKSAWTCE
jgi:hypothetical protein